MKAQMFYTKRHHIPAFQVIVPDGAGDLIIDFLNTRTKVHESMSMSELIHELTRMDPRQGPPT